MKKIVAVLGVIGIVIIAGFVISNNNDGKSNSSESNDANQTASLDPNTVVIANFKFTPDSITVKKGTTVTWRNTDTAKHDVNFTDESLDDGPLLDKDATYTYTFNDIGTFEYACSPHPFMKAKVIVN